MFVLDDYSSYRIYYLLEIFIKGKITGYNEILFIRDLFADSINIVIL